VSPGIISAPVEAVKAGQSDRIEMSSYLEGQAPGVVVRASGLLLEARQAGGLHHNAPRSPR
jgi:hypothetical protein